MHLPYIFQFEIPAGEQFSAQAGDVIGWLDVNAGGQGAVGFNENGDMAACREESVTSVSVGTSISGSSDNMVYNQYSIEVCYGT